MPKAAWDVLATVFVVLLLGAPGSLPEPAHSQAARYDTSWVEVRTPPADVLARYREDPDFRYDREAVKPDSWWDRAKAWLAQHILDALNDRRVGRVLDVVLYALAIAAIVFAILRLLRMDGGAVFYNRRARRAGGFEDVDENIQDVDFEALVEDAVRARDYRRAVRLSYLRVLKLLEAHGLIAWHPEKTNHDYLDELREPALHGTFARLTASFEYVWYGHFALDEERYARVRDDFEGFFRRLTNRDG